MAILYYDLSLQGGIALIVAIMAILYGTMTDPYKEHNCGCGNYDQSLQRAQLWQFCTMTYLYRERNCGNFVL